MQGLALHEGAAAAYRLIDATNEFIAATAPWALAKDPASADRLTQVLFDAAEAIRLAAVLLEPIMPSSSREILARRRVRRRPQPDRVAVGARGSVCCDEVLSGTPRTGRAQGRPDTK